MEKELIIKILEYSIHSPSTHNTQPWLFKILSEGVSIYFDEKLFLPEADKDGRDLYISFGCLIENIIISSGHFGFEVNVSTFFKNDNHIVDIVFTKDNLKINNYNNNEKLFNTILKRVNSRGKFKEEDIFNNVTLIIEDSIVELNACDCSLTILDDKEDIKSMAELTREAMHLAYNKSSFRREVSHWMNSNLSFKKEGIPGYALKLPLVLSLIIPFIIRYFDIGKLLGRLNFESIKSSPLIFVFSSKNNLKNDWINIGIYAEKFMLLLQSEGYQTSIFVGSIEISDLYKEVSILTKIKEGRPQFIFAVGHIDGKHKTTPRHKLEDKLIV